MLRRILVSKLRINVKIPWLCALSFLWLKMANFSHLKGSVCSVCSVCIQNQPASRPIFAQNWFKSLPNNAPMLGECWTTPLCSQIRLKLATQDDQLKFRVPTCRVYERLFFELIQSGKSNLREKKKILVSNFSNRAKFMNNLSPKWYLNNQ